MPPELESVGSEGSSGRRAERSSLRLPSESGGWTEAEHKALLVAIIQNGSTRFTEIAAILNLCEESRLKNKWNGEMKRVKAKGPGYDYKTLFTACTSEFTRLVSGRGVSVRLGVSDRALLQGRILDAIEEYPLSSTIDSQERFMQCKMRVCDVFRKYFDHLEYIRDLIKVSFKSSLEFALERNGDWAPVNEWIRMMLSISQSRPDIFEPQIKKDTSHVNCGTPIRLYSDPIPQYYGPGPRALRLAPDDAARWPVQPPILPQTFSSTACDFLRSILSLPLFSRYNINEANLTPEMAHGIMVHLLSELSLEWQRLGFPFPAYSYGVLGNL